MKDLSTIAGTATSPVAGNSATAELSAMAIKYAKSRGISRKTLEQFDVHSATVFFPREQVRAEAIVFPYYWDNEIVQRKARSLEGKMFTQTKGGRTIFFNLDRVIEANPDTVFITEGEWDALALVEAGIPYHQVLSVPNGAREHSQKDEGQSEGEIPKGYRYVEEALEYGLKRVKRFVWCGDNDSAGLCLRQDMMNIIGPARFWYVEWPEGIKDANEYLVRDPEGRETLAERVMRGCMPWPVEGLFGFDDIPEPPPLTIWNTEFGDWDKKLHFSPGMLSVCTGHPGHGKTSAMLQLWTGIARGYDFGLCFASFETRIKPHQRRIIRQAFHGKQEWQMSDEEKRKADDFIRHHFKWILHKTEQPELDWVLDMAEVAIIRHGCRVLQIDPWNRLEGNRRPGENETDYIGRCLRSVHTFAKQMNVHVQILAHPSKMDGNRKGSPPQLEDIAGSKAWDSMPDQGLCVHRPKKFEGGQRKTEAILYHLKKRYDELGQECALGLNYDLKHGIFVSRELGKGE